MIDRAKKRERDAQAWATMTTKYPTAALAVFEVDICAWAELAPQGARLAAFVRPRDLEGR